MISCCEELLIRIGRLEEHCWAFNDEEHTGFGLVEWDNLFSEVEMLDSQQFDDFPSEREWQIIQLLRKYFEEVINDLWWGNSFLLSLRLFYVFRNGTVLSF